MASGLVTYEGVGALSQWREPEEVLEQAKKAAVALKGVIELKANKVVFNNEVYLEREDWGTVGAFFGCTAKSIETRFVDYGEAGRGFEAVAVVIDGSGREIGRAESMTLDTEENWGEVPKYVWKDKLDGNGNKIWNPTLRNGKGGYEATKVQDGSTKKPLFQLKSMAQTRAEAKALKGVFSWVVVLAGYRPTPAEELTGHEDFGGGQGRQESKPPVQQPSRASEKKAEPAQTQSAQQQSSQAAQQTNTVEVSGVIENAKEGKEGVWWLTIPSGVVMVPADKTDADMKQGYFIKFRGVKKHSDKIGDYHILASLMELSEVQEAEVVSPEVKKKHDDQVSQIGEELFGEKDGKEAVQGMVESGTLKPASSLPSNGDKKPGTIGRKRAQRLYTLMSINKDKNNGFNEEEAKKIASALPVPVEHLSDLEVSMYEQFEKWANGTEDFREFWKD